MRSRLLLLTVTLASLSVSCQGTSPYLRDLKPAYECDAQMHCTAIAKDQEVRIGTAYLKALLADLKACYKEKTP